MTPTNNNSSCIIKERWQVIFIGHTSTWSKIIITSSSYSLQGPMYPSRSAGSPLSFLLLFSPVLTFFTSNTLTSFNSSALSWSPTGLEHRLERGRIWVENHWGKKRFAIRKQWGKRSRDCCTNAHKTNETFPSFSRRIWKQEGKVRRRKFTQ